MDEGQPGDEVRQPAQSGAGAAAVAIAPEVAPALDAPAGVRLWPALLTLVIGMLGMFLGGCLVGAAWIPRDGTPIDLPAMLRDPNFMILSLLVSQGALLWAIWKVPGWLGDVGPSGWLARMGWHPERFSLVDVAVTTVGTLAAGSLAGAALRGVSVQGVALQAFAGAATSAAPAQFAWLLLFGAIAPGLVEELAFRGLLQQRLAARFGPWVGVGVTALAFGAWHFDVRQGLSAAALGLWLGFAAHRQRTVVNVAFAHLLNNALGFTSARLGSTADEVAGLQALVPALVLAGCAGLLSWRTRAPAPA